MGRGEKTLEPFALVPFLETKGAQRCFPLRAIAQPMMWNRRQFLRSSALLAAVSLASGPASLRASSQDQVHVVQRGDTLSGIAQRYNLSVAELKARNNLTSDRINIGQSLLVAASTAPATTYVVQAGDTLGQIARSHQTSVAAIRSANNLQGDRIFPGQELRMPASSASPSYRHISEVVRVTRALRSRRSWEYIVAHHSGVNQGNARIYDRFHRRQMRMENGLAYHFVIGNGSDSGNGEIEIGDRWLRQLQGGHVRTARINDIGIGICLVGNFEERRPTAAQLSAFTELVTFLKFDFLNGRCKFTVHRDVDGNQTLCPGRNFPTARMHQLFS
jgi:LysM repeat protein